MSVCAAVFVCVCACARPRWCHLLGVLGGLSPAERGAVGGTHGLAAATTPCAPLWRRLCCCHHARAQVPLEQRDLATITDARRKVAVMTAQMRMQLQQMAADSPTHMGMQHMGHM